MTHDLTRDSLRAAELLLEPEQLMLRDGPVRNHAVLVRAR